jgi:hypothetical protein
MKQRIIGYKTGPKITNSSYGKFERVAEIETKYNEGTTRITEETVFAWEADKFLPIN